MRIIAIGLGGAGCRIVDSLYSADRKGSRITCVYPLAVDVDEETITSLGNIPGANKLCYSAIDPAISALGDAPDQMAAVDIAEVLARIHNFESGETDAIFICMGLGGSLADIAPHIISGLRSSSQEMIFGLVTLPCLAEGEKRSAQAADQIDILSSLLDGMILFDNETWYKKTKSLKTEVRKKEKSLVQMLGLVKPEPELSSEMTTYALLNEGIVRRISLILKAGEFNAEGGIDLAEVVLDSGEVLNTMKGMGFITIGYAVERLPSNPLAFLTQFRSQGVFDEENKKKAARIVDLAKQAIYNEVSTPCDMTSAHKALVLIAGPSHELSMKGFMTVRKWIDRSIAGLETRSGDYPVVNTKNIAIIVMLSGLENIPRVTELREIREQHHAWAERRISGSDRASDGHLVKSSSPPIRDEMIVLPARMKKEADTDIRRPGEVTQVPLSDTLPEKPVAVHKSPEVMTRVPEPVQPPIVVTKKTTESVPIAESQDIVTTSPVKSSRHKVVVAEGTRQEIPPSHPVLKHHPHQKVQPPETLRSHKVPDELSKRSAPHIPGPGDKDVSRQRIELELQRQRLKAISGRIKTSESQVPPVPETPIEPVKKAPSIRARPAIRSTTPHGETEPEPVHKTVIIPKRKIVTTVQETPAGDPQSVEPVSEEPVIPEVLSDTINDEPEGEAEAPINIRDTPYRAKDQIFAGKGVQKPKTGLTRDVSLLHTHLRPKKPSPAMPDTGVPDVVPEETRAGEEPKKPETKKKRPDDLSWI